MEQLYSGITLMVVGMTVVFVFLVALIFIMTGMSAFLNKYFPDIEKPVKQPAGGGRGRPTSEELAAITAAVHQYIRGKK